MKALLKSCFSLLAFLLFSCLVVQAKIYKPLYKSQNNEGYINTKAQTNIVAVVKVFTKVVFDVADVPERTEPLQVYSQVMPSPVNDAKPDNTNYQLVRKRYLKIRKMESNV